MGQAELDDPKAEKNRSWENDRAEHHRRDSTIPCSSNNQTARQCHTIKWPVDRYVESQFNSHNVQKLTQDLTQRCLQTKLNKEPRVFMRYKEKDVWTGAELNKAQDQERRYQG